VKNEFAQAARRELANPQLRANIRNATHTIREKREQAVGEMPDWEELREAGRLIKERTMRHLAEHLEQLEQAVTAAGGRVHWAADAAEAKAKRYLRTMMALEAAARDGKPEGGRATEPHSYR